MVRESYSSFVVAAVATAVVFVAQSIIFLGQLSRQSKLLANQNRGQILRLSLVALHPCHAARLIFFLI